MIRAIGNELRSEVSGGRNRLKADLKRVKSVVMALIALKLAVLFVLAWNRRLVMDEFQQFGWAKYVPDEIGRLAVQHPKAEGYAFFFDLAHLIGWDARSMLLLGRMETALLACGTLAIVYALARTLGQSKLRSALIVLVLLSFSNFIERIIETRAEPLATFFGAAALLVAVRARDRRWRMVGAGVLSGLAFLSTQKALYFDLALGLALFGDAALARRYARGVERGALLVLGWLIPIVVYCLALGGDHALTVGHNLFFGPIDVATAGGDPYRGLRHYVVQTLVRNAVLYLFCFSGMVLALIRWKRLEGARRIALIFSVVVTALVFAHNQPWPYVFVMALPFLALWATGPLDALAGRRLYLATAWAVLGVAVAASFVRNVQALRLDNHEQLAVVERAESLLAPDEVYFDAIGMVPNRSEPSVLWLGKGLILQTRREGKGSEAWRIFASNPPKLIIWSYRMDGIAPVVGPLIEDSYARVAPNIRLAGVRFRLGEAARFEVPIAGSYALYDGSGRQVAGVVEVGGVAARAPVELGRGAVTVRLASGPAEALLLLEGDYAGKFAPGEDSKALFAGVYN